MRKEKEENNKINIGLILVLIFISLGMVKICAAGFLGFGNSASWKEDVLLHDGSKIIVERWQKHGGSHELGQEPGVSDQSITFTVPGTDKNIKWKDESSDVLGGRSNFYLVALHILNNIPYIITTPRLCLSYNKWDRPNPPYVIFKYEDKKWKRIELAELPTEFKNINVVVETQGYDEKRLVNQGIVSAEIVKQMNSELTQEEYKTIVRTPLNGVGCEKMVRVEGGWYGIDWFSDQPNYAACVKFCHQKNVKNEDCPCDSLFKGGK